jgi:hypothetical protein
LSDVFLWPFQALTVTPSTAEGITLEVFTPIAMVVYALLTWAVVKAVHLLIIPTTSEPVSLFRREASQANGNAREKNSLTAVRLSAGVGS